MQSAVYSLEPKQLGKRRRGRKGRVSKAGLAALNKELYGHIYSCRKTLRRLLTFAHGRWLCVLFVYILSLSLSFFPSRFVYLSLALFPPVPLLPLSPPIRYVPLSRSLFFRSLSYSFSFILFSTTHTHARTILSLFSLLFFNLLARFFIISFSPRFVCYANFSFLLAIFVIVSSSFPHAFSLTFI